MLLALIKTIVPIVVNTSLRTRTGEEWTFHRGGTKRSKMSKGRSASENIGNHWDRQSQPSRWGRHSWELQDQPFAFCRRLDSANIISTVFSMHSIGFQLRATEPEWKSTLKIPWYYSMSLYKPKAVYVCSVCCEWAATHCSRWRSSNT